MPEFLDDETFDHAMEQLIAMAGAIYAHGATSFGDLERMQAEGWVDEYGKPTKQLSTKAISLAAAGVKKWAEVISTARSDARFFN